MMLLIYCSILHLIVFLSYEVCTYKYFIKEKSSKTIPEIGADRELSWDSTPRRSATMIFQSDGSFRVRSFLRTYLEQLVYI